MDGVVFWLFVYGVVWLSGVWLNIAFATANTFASATVSSCWDSDERCFISAQLYRSNSWGQPDLPIEIDCLLPWENQNVSSSYREQNEPPYLLHRFEHVHNVTLNGCHTQLNVQTYGYEFLPNCGKIFKTSIERFHGDHMSKLHCPQQLIELEILILNNNEISAFYEDAFENLVALREIYFKQNSVRHINRTAFENLPQIELIHVEQEECLALKEADFFERTGVVDLRLIALKSVHAHLLQHLPASIRFLYVAEMDGIADRALRVENPFALQNVSVLNCNLDSFVLEDLFASVTFLNLSKNALTHFSYEVNETTTQCALQTLDLSENKLEYLHMEWLRDMQCLRELLLQGNALIALSIQRLLFATPSIHFIDLRDNQLQLLGDTDADTVELMLDCDHTRIVVDRNPWNCLWLLNFTHSHPEKFRIFQYRKFISKINVNGLECRASVEISHSASKPSKTSEPSTLAGGEEVEPPALPINSSAYHNLFYDNHRDAKRNQRSEALIIVFMLPLGIALLFLLLYMWIYCQKMFHLSYYRTVPIIGKTIPPETNENCPDVPSNSAKNDYEIPLKGAVSICNCNHIGLDGGDNAGGEEGCKKQHGQHHITYEGAPNEKPYRLYEEILADEHHAEIAQSHPFYDHLTYVEGYQNQMANN